MKSNEEIYRKYVDELRDEIVNRYLSQNRKASGKFQDEIESEISNLSVKLFGAPHSVFVEKGRGPGKFPPVKVIEDWIEVKQGLPTVFKERKKQFAYLIARKIAREGTDGSDILESSIQNFVEKRLWKLMDELGDAYAVRLQNDIVPLIKKFAKN